MASKLVVKQKTKYRKITREEVLHIVLDIGNGFVKAMIVPNFGEEIIFPHRVAQMQESNYKNIERSQKYANSRFKGTSVFRNEENLGFVVGQHAVGLPEGKRIAGAEKYVREHYGSLALSAFLQLYPGGHPNVNVVVLHPANINQSNFDSMINSLKGTHKATLPNGEKVSYRVRQITPIEEPVSGLQTFILNTRGNDYVRNGFSFKPGTNILVLDIGFELSSLVPVFINRDGELEVNIAQARVISVGINNVVESLETELKNSFYSLSARKQIPDDITIGAIRNDSTVISGIEYKSADDGTSVSELVDRSMYPLASRVQQYYINDYSGGINFGGIVISGGGGAAAYNYISEKVLDHSFIFPAEEELDRMQVGNVRGAAKGLIAFLGIQAQQTEE